MRWKRWKRRRPRHFRGVCVFAGAGFACLRGSCRPKQASIRRAVRAASRTGASFRLCPLAQAEWLQKTAEEIKKFGVDEALRDVSCLSFESALLAGP